MEVQFKTVTSMRNEELNVLVYPLFVYGSLKKGFPLANKLYDALYSEYLGESIAPPDFDMLGVNNSFPLAVYVGQNKGASIQGETYLVDMFTFLSLANMEMNAGYNLHKVKVKCDGNLMEVLMFIIDDKRVPLIDFKRTENVQYDKETNLLTWTRTVVDYSHFG